MKKNLLILFTVVLTCVSESNAQKADAKYLNEVPPGTTPAVFASGKISTTDQFEFGAVFSKDHHEFYYAVEINGKAETRMMKLEKGTWTSPATVLKHDTYSYNDPFLTPDEKRLFFISDRPLSGEGPKKDYDIWYVERRAGKWSEPINAGKNINSDKNEYYSRSRKMERCIFLPTSAMQNRRTISTSIVRNFMQVNSRLR